MLAEAFAKKEPCCRLCGFTEEDCRYGFYPMMQHFVDVGLSVVARDHSKGDRIVSWLASEDFNAPKMDMKGVSPRFKWLLEFLDDCHHKTVESKALPTEEGKALYGLFGCTHKDYEKRSLFTKVSTLALDYAKYNLNYEYFYAEATGKGS